MPALTPMSLTFDKANAVLTVVDTETKNTWLFTGQVSIKMDYANATVATYTLCDARQSLIFKQSEIEEIGGSAPDPDPEVTITELAAVLPLYV